MKKSLLLLSLLTLSLVGCSFDPGQFQPDNPNNHGDSDFKFDDIPGEDGEDPYEGKKTEEQDYSDVNSEKIDVDVKTDTEDVDVKSDESTSITDLSVDGITFNDNVFTITKAGTFTFSGSFVGQIYINAGDEDDVEVELKGLTLKCETNSPIYCLNANELKVSAKKGTVNYIYDTRAAETTEDETQGGGAIYSKCDTKISGKGTLYVTGNYNNGIHCTKSLKLQQTVNDNSSLQVNARNIAIKGNDSVDVKSGNIVAIASGGEGIKTTDSDISAKGNQRGDITICGGHIDIYSCQDGIEASHNVVILDGTDSETGLTTKPVVNIETSNYSQYSGEVNENSTKTLYLKTSSYSSSYKYSVLFLNEDSSTSWVDAAYDKKQSSGRSTYYYFKVQRPTSAKSFKIYRFNADDSSHEISNASQASQDYININENYDTIAFTTSGNRITAGNWSSYTTQSSGGGYQPGGFPGGGGPGREEEGNTNKSEYSSKGIKADNIIDISGGLISIKAYDDGIHANYGETLENETTGLGDVVISGGDIEIYAADDGLHADRYLTINGGTINITYSYEGVEANYITIAGGYTKVYSVDDGLNAANKAGLNPVIEVKGGIIDVTVYGGDVDGIDSNGSFTQSGGKVITKGGNGEMSTGLDVDGTASITGGTFVAFGRTEKTPSKGSGITNYSLSGTYSIGNYKIAFADGIEVEVNTKYSYSVINVYSDSSTKITVTKI